MKVHRFRAESASFVELVREPWPVFHRFARAVEGGYRVDVPSDAAFVRIVRMSASIRVMAAQAGDGTIRSTSMRWQASLLSRDPTQSKH
jgi:hypothetical protein